MPSIDDVLNKKKKKFVKKSYRAWDLTGTGEPDIAPTKQVSKQDKSSHNENTILENTASPEKKKTQISPKKVTPKNMVPKAGTGNVTETPTKAIDNKLENRLDYNKDRIGLPIDDNQITNRSQIDDNQITNRLQIGYALDASSLEMRAQKTTGLGRKILDLVVDICLAKQQNTTGPIDTSLLVSATQSTYSSVKGTIVRLVSNGFLVRNKGKTARGGYINLTLPERVKVALLDHRSEVDQNKNALNMLAAIRSQLDYNSPYISSSNITTTNKNNNNNIDSLTGSLPDEWKNISYAGLEEFGFTINQLKQLYPLGTIDPASVQESINHFVYGLEYNPKVKAYEDPLNVFMGVLRKGQLWIEKGYKSSQVIAQEQLLKSREEQQKKIEALHKKTYDVAFNDWKSKLEDEEVSKILESISDELKKAPNKVKLRSFFQENIWDKIKDDYFIDG